MSKENQIVNPKEVLQLAKAAVLEAEARKMIAEAREAEATAALMDIGLGKAQEAEKYRLADDEHNRVLRFLGTVNAANAKIAVDTLVGWHRVDPGCDITMVIDSPGGGIIEGFHLYDTLLWLKREGHKLTTITNGMAASMAGILLQAGHKRIAGPNATILIHEASFSAGGSFGQVEDTMELVKKLQDRLLGILAERSKLSKSQIKTRWKRKNWWLDADEALKYGFVDKVE